jgi:hypothetical protein
MFYRKVVKKALPYFEEEYIERITLPAVGQDSTQDPEEARQGVVEGVVYEGIPWGFTEILDLFSHLASVAPTSLVDVLHSRLI